MKPLPVLALLCIGLTCMQSAAAQRGPGRGRPDEITNRVGVFFADAEPPKAEAEGKPLDLAKADMVVAGAGMNQPTVLYLFDGADDQDVRQQFERTMFAGDEIGIMLRCFHCGSIDLQKAEGLKAQYAKLAPVFVVFDASGKAEDPVSMSGYKPSVKSLQNQLVKAAQGTVKPSLNGFAKEYGDLVRDLENLLGKKKIASERMAKAGADKVKKAGFEKDLEAIDKDEKKLLDHETEMIKKLNLPERPGNARRLGERQWGGGGGRGGRGGNNGGGGGNNGGGGKSGGG
jgi:uncharacterized membrane protein YgcG